MNDQETLQKFFELGRTASFHFADDSGKELQLAYNAERAARALYEAASPSLRIDMRDVARQFLWSL